MASALDGITVVDATQGMAGALATMFLCDNGARVIRVESTKAGPEREIPGNRVWHRGKESVALDPSEGPDERDTFLKLVRGADVLVETFRPSSPIQTIVDYTQLSGVNPGLVHCSITACGKRGPLKDEPPIEELVVARMGLLEFAPSFRDGPPHLVHPVANVGAGLLAAQGIVASLLARERTGRGRKVDTSLMAGALVFNPPAVGDRVKPFPFPNRPIGGAPFYSVYECADGQWVQLGCIHSEFIDMAAAVMGILEIVLDPKYGDGRWPTDEKARSELYEIVAGAIKQKPYSEWEKIFEEADVPFARAATVEEAMDDLQVRSNGMTVRFEDPQVGPIVQMGLPIQLSETPGHARGPSHIPGEDTASVLANLPGTDAETRTSFPNPMELQPRPLDGVSVLEISNVIAGPAAGKMLADLGADVIKLEPHGGDLSRRTLHQLFMYMNSNKRGVSADTRTAEGQEIARKLAARADVLLANMRPGATERMGIGTDIIRGLNPRLIETHVTAYGWTGPYAHRAGVDPLAQALMGLQRVQGGPENPPVTLVRLAITDWVGAAIGALGTLLALFVRERTGIVQRVDTNLLNAAIVIGSGDFVSYDGKPPRRRADKEQYGYNALHRLYEAADGWLYLIAEAQEDWVALCDALGVAKLATDARFRTEEIRRRNDAILASEIAQAVKRSGLTELSDRLKKAGIAHSPVVYDYVPAFPSDDHALANDMVVEYGSPPAGPMTFLGNSVLLENTAPVQGRPTPFLGEHNRELLGEIGYSSAEIEELHRKEVVRTEEPS